MYTKEVHVHTHRRLAAVTFSLPLVFLFSSYFGAGDQTQGPLHARQALY